MADDPPREFQRRVAIVRLGGDQGTLEDLVRQRRGRGGLELGDQAAGVEQARLALVLSADIGRLQSEIESAARGCPPGRAA